MMWLQKLTVNYNWLMYYYYYYYRHQYHCFWIKFDRPIFPEMFQVVSGRQWTLWRFMCEIFTDWMPICHQPTPSEG